MKKLKAPPKLSPQEARVYATLRFGADISVLTLYACARDTTRKQAAKVGARRRQMHVGVIIQRLNNKRPGSVIRPGKTIGTYVLRRRR